MTESIIKCPHCGYEYLAAEIFYPDDLLGRPKDIVRMPDGRIDFYDGEMPNMCQTYTCDNCGKVLSVTAALKFTAEVNEKLDFDNDYCTPLYKDRLILTESNLFE